MRKKIYYAVALMVFGALVVPTVANAQRERSEIDDRYKWDVSDLFADDAAWSAKKDQMVGRIGGIADFKGRLGRSAKDLLEYFDYTSEINRELTSVYNYASLLQDQDLRVADNVSKVKAMENVYNYMSEVSSFVDPELAAIDDAKYEEFMAEEPRLRQLYGMAIGNIIRAKRHALTPDESALMAKVGIMGNTPANTYDLFCSAEMTWPTITLSDGREVELNQPTFFELRESGNRLDRQTAYRAFWNNFRRYEGTFGELMNGNIKRNIFYAKAYRYSSAVEAALEPGNIPVDVYTSLVDNVNKNLGTFHRYLRLKQRLMGLEQLAYCDLYAPAVEGVQRRYTYEEAAEMVMKAVEPLGQEYCDVIRHAFTDRWVDVYPTKGKAGGAYSNGSSYDCHPFVKMNFNGSYETVGTLIHELGHAMHSRYSNTYQPYQTSDYSMFVAEVASTFNEALLDELMLKTITDKKEKIALLMSMLDGFKGTLFRQTQFAEFELRMHQMAESGEPITGKALSELYGEIIRKYYGDEQGVCKIDETEDIEWAFVPHFYYGFYVYQYATSFVASQALAEMVINGGETERDRYLKFLSAGCSKYPIDILKDAGVDMTSGEPFDHLIKRMNQLMDELEELID